MKDSIYLYGENYDAKILRELPYLSALYRKIQWSEELVSELMEIDYMSRDMRRVNASIDAQKFNRKLIQEMF